MYLSVQGWTVANVPLVPQIPPPSELFEVDCRRVVGLVIEFANVELLLMRTYVDELDAQLPQMYRRISAPQHRFDFPIVKPYNQLLREVLHLIADVIEVTERVDNTFKVTDDVYWNRLYRALLSVLRVHVWQRGVKHRLELLQQAHQADNW